MRTLLKKIVGIIYNIVYNGNDNIENLNSTVILGISIPSII